MAVKCPECGMMFGVQERICRRCRFCPELGRAVEMEPPRSGRWGRREVIAPHVKRRLGHVKTANANLNYQTGRLLLTMLLGVIPGLGHLVLRQYLRAGVFALLVWAGLGFASFTSDPTAGQLVLGLALSVHTMSIVTLIPKSWDLTTLSRFAATLGVMFALAGALYMPWSRTLMAQWGQFEMVDAARLNQYRWISNFYTSITGLLFFIAVGAFSYLVSRAVSHHIQQRRNKAQ